MKKTQLIDRRALELVQTVLTTQSLSVAAEQLNVTSSALSHQLRELEQRIGGELILRRKRPYRVTALGQVVLEAARDLLPQFVEYEAKLARLSNGEAGRLNLAIECHSCYQWLMPTLDQFREDWADVEVDIASGHLFDPLNALAESALDLVVTSDPEPINGISYIPLFDYESVLIVSRHHALAKQGFVTPEELKSETLIVYPVAPQKLDIYRKFLHPAGLAPKATRQVEITAIMMQLVASGRGVTAVPSWAAVEYTDRGIVVPLRMGEGIFSTLYAAVREADLGRSYIRDFLLLAKDMPLSTLRGVEKPAHSIDLLAIDQS